MTTIANFHIDKLFEVIRFHISPSGEPNPIYHYSPTQTIQVHTPCSMAFACQWDVTSNMGYPVFEGKSFHCPRCGQHITDRYPYFESGAEAHRIVPYALDMTATERQHTLDLIIRAQCVKFFPRYHDATTKGAVKYRLRIDFKARKTYYARWTREGYDDTKELHPFDSDGPGISLSETVLGYLVDTSSLHHETRKEADAFMRDVQACFQRKLEEHVKYPVRSVWTPGCLKQLGESVWRGPISNMVWRLSCPDAPNIKSSDVFRQATRRDQKPLLRLMELGRQGVPYLEAVRRVYRFPSTPAMHKRIPQLCFRNFLGASRVMRVIGNPDLAIQAVDTLFLRDSKAPSDRYALYELRDCVSFIRILAKAKGPEYALHFLAPPNGRREHLRDTVRSYKLLNKDNRRKAMTARVRTKDLHDYLSDLYDKQVNKNQKIEYKPKDLALAGEMAGLCFCLPPDTDQMRMLGRVMHNCVYTYREGVLAGRKRIVAAFRDRKPVICIELQGDTIVQAKLQCNKPVHEDEVLQQALIQWAESRKLQISTYDVQREEVRAGA